MTTPRKTLPKRYLLLLLPSLPLVLCLAGGVVSYNANRELPTQSAQVERLSPLALAHIQETQQLMAATGDTVWPGFGSAQIPLMIYNEQYSFLCGAREAPTGWETLPGQPCLRGIYPDPQAFTHLVGDQWVGSMTTQEYMGIRLRQDLGEVLPGLLADVFPYGLITPTLGSDRYIGALVHESFHAFQAETARGRFDDAEQAYASSDSYWFNDPAAREDWKKETTALFEALNADDEAQMREHAREFLQIRAERRRVTLTAEALVLYERSYEWLEGLAKYTELKTLQTAEEMTSYVPLPSISADPNFHQYADFERLWRSELSQMKRQARQQGDTRFYYTGMAQAVLLDRLDPDWKAQIFDEGAWLEDLLAEALK